MNGTDCIIRAIKSHIPGSRTEVAVENGKYVVTVTSSKFASHSRSDNEAHVYGAFGSLPLHLLAKIIQIKTVAPR